jgi:TatD DNase family protein
VKLFDSHCHLQDSRIFSDIEQVVARAERAGVTGMLCCGSCEDDWEAVLDIARRFKTVVPALGIHPWYASERTGRWKERLEELLVSDNRIAVGEIGLDHALGDRDDADQEHLFREQLYIAKTFQRPVSIHCRKAWGALMEIFRSDPSLADRSVIHSYSGPVELIGELQGYRVSLSFSGSITRSSNRRGRSAVAAVAPENILIETDAPDIVPAGHTEPNEPAALPAIAETAAQIRGCTTDEIGELTAGNALALFGNPGSVTKQ